MESVVIDGRYIADHYPGIGRYVFHLVKALASTAPDRRITLLTGVAERQTRFDLGALQSLGVALLPLGAGPLSVRGQLGVRAACRRLAPSLFHAPHLFSATRVRCASLVTINDLIPIHAPRALSSMRHRLLYRGLLRRALAAATGIVTLSQAVRDELCGGWGVSSDRISVVPGAADPGFRPASAAQIAALQARLGVPERYVLYVGTNRPHKNLVRLVEAWAGLTGSRRRGCRLVIAGPEDPRHNEPRRRAEALEGDAFLFLGKIDERDLAALYSGARLVVQPSLHEGFGLPVIEAMACGAPVACSRTPVLDEVSAGAAVQFDPTKVEEIGGAVDRALNEEGLRERLVARGFRRAHELSWEQTAALTLEAYGKALRRYRTAGSGS